MSRVKKRQFDNGIEEYRINFNPKTRVQEYLFECLLNDPLVVAVGPAGTGKSYAMAAAGIQLYQSGYIDRIIVLRNPLPTGTSLGFFPGTEKEKLSVWCKPIIETFKKVIGRNDIFTYLMNKDIISFDSIETLKGISYDYTFLIVEEAQEMSFELLKMLSTRIGHNSVICFNGDANQKNSRLKDNGFMEFCDRIKEYDQKIDDKKLEGKDYSSWEIIRTPIVCFEKEDIIRSDLCRKMVECLY